MFILFSMVGYTAKKLPSAVDMVNNKDAGNKSVCFSFSKKLTKTCEMNIG